jgi:hypothetical protein
VKWVLPFCGEKGKREGRGNFSIYAKTDKPFFVFYLFISRILQRIKNKLIG